MSAPATRADDPGDGSRLRRLVQAGYLLQILSILLALFGDRDTLPGAATALPAGAMWLVLRSKLPGLGDAPLAAHIAWQARTFWWVLGAWGIATLLLGPLLFLGLPFLGWAYALIVLWAAWRIGRGLHALRKDQPLVTRRGKDA